MGQAASSSETDSLTTLHQENTMTGGGCVGSSSVLVTASQEFCPKKQNGETKVHYCSTTSTTAAAAAAAAASSGISSLTAIEEGGCINLCKQPSQTSRLQIVEMLDISCQDQLRKMVLHHDNWTQYYYCDRRSTADLTVGLPEECLASVFEKLSTAERNACSLVCKRWHAIDAKWRRQLSLEGQRDLCKDLSSILLRFQHLTSLTLKCHRRSSSSSIDDFGLALVARMLPQLERLKLKGCRALTDAGLEQFSTIINMTGSRSNFRKLSLSCCSFGAKGVNAVLLNCVNTLEELSVKRMKRLLENPYPIHGAGPGKNRLLRISLKDTLNSQIFGSVIASATRLQTLILARNPGYWDHLLQVATENLTHLQELRCESLQMSDISLVAISRCKNLEVLYLLKASDCTNHGLSALVSGCPYLKKLYVDDRGNSSNSSKILGDAGLTSVAKRCTQLREVVFVGLNIGSQSGLAKMASACTALERLALCSSHSVGDAELHCLANKCMSLRKLCIKECPGVTDYGVQSFAKGCPNLIKLKIKKCCNVTPFAAFWLQQNRPSLHVSLDISVQYCNNLQNPAAFQLRYADHHDMDQSMLMSAQLQEADRDRSSRNDQYVRYNNNSSSSSSGNMDRFIRSPTTMACSSRSLVVKSKLTLAAANLLRKLPRSSANCSTPLVG